MKNNTIKIIVASVLVFFLATLADLVPFWMPKMNEMMLLLAVSVLLLIWAGFVMFELAEDEREAQHRMDAGRIAYLSGITVLTVAIVLQGLQYAIDPWIAVALSVMVLSKLGARFYFDKYK